MSISNQRGQCPGITVTYRNWSSFVCNMNLFELSSGSQVGQELDNMIGHGGSDGQVSSAGLESVLVSNPVDGVGHSLQFVRVRSAGNGADFLGFVTDLFLFAFFVHADTVGSLEATQWQYEIAIYYRVMGIVEDELYEDLC